MTYCLNAHCPHPENPDQGKFCLYCGSKLYLGDRYRPLFPLGKKHSGHTFLAIDEGTTSKNKCVIKQVIESRIGKKNITEINQKRQQDISKIQVISQHPQIPQLLGYFPAESSLDPSYFLVQEYIEGQDLNEILIEEGVFTEDKIKYFLSQILPVIQFIHSQGIIHRDLNPNNIIRAASGQLFLVDFSTAKITSKTALYQTGTLIGSVVYTAPEQLRGKASFASDIYSLGVICIYLMTLVDPWDLLSSYEGINVWQDYLTHPVSKQFRKIINQMLADNLSERYQSAQEIWQKLQPNSQLITPTFNLPQSHTKVNTEDSWQCQKTITHHLSAIYCLNFSPDGQYLASGSADNTIKVWKIATAKLMCNLTGHKSIITSVVFSPDNKLLLSASWDYTIRIWQLETGLEIERLTEHTGWIYALTLSRDGKILVSGSADKTIKIWDLENKLKPITLAGHSAAIHSLALSSDGKILASGSADKTIKIWDLPNHQEQKTITGHLDTITALAFSGSGKILISGSLDQTIKIWRLDQQQLLYNLQGHSAAITCLALNLGSYLLVSGSEDQTIKIWHPTNGELKSSLSAHTASIQAVAISPDSQIIASGSQDKTIKLWRFNS